MLFGPVLFSAHVYGSFAAAGAGLAAAQKYEICWNLLDFFMKRKLHEKKNAPSENILFYCDLSALAKQLKRVSEYTRQKGARRDLGSRGGQLLKLLFIRVLQK